VIVVAVVIFPFVTAFMVSVAFVHLPSTVEVMVVWVAT